MTRKSQRKVRVSVPATTSNLGPGFDVLGMALELRNEIEASWEKGAPGALAVEIRGEGEDVLPRGEDNLVVSSFRALAPVRDFPRALRLRLTNRIPLARGLGSSAAARLGGLLAAAALTGSREDVAALACRMEGHPDNAAPAFHGGLCASLLDESGLRCLRLPPPRGLTAVACIPNFKVSTEHARGLLPKKVPLKDAVFTSARLAFLLGALERRRFDWLGFAMEDALHQPYRKALVPGMDQIIAAARKAGAYGAALSGSGPTMLALASPRRARAAGRAMQVEFAKRGLKSRCLVLGIAVRGAQVR